MLKKVLIKLLVFATIQNSAIFADTNYKEHNMKEDRLIPLEVLFGNPDRMLVKMNEKANYISYVAPLNGVLNVFVAPYSDIKAAKAITSDTHRGIRSYTWASNNTHIIYAMDEKGDENFRLYSVNVSNLEAKLLTPLAKVKANIIKTSKKFPDEIIVSTNQRNAECFDLYRINIVNGKSELLFENNDQYSSFTIDEDFKLRFAYKMLPDGYGEIYQFNHDLSVATLFQKIEIEDMLNTNILHITADGKALYMIDGSGRDKSALIEIELSSQKKTLIFEDAKADIADGLVEPITKKIQAIAVDHLVKKWTILDDAITPDLNYLSGVSTGQIDVTVRADNDNKWIVVFLKDNGPNEYYLYDRTKKEAQFLFVSNSKQEGYQFTKMHPLTIKARDDLELVSYLSLPRWLDKQAKLNAPIPLVLLVHGGPNARDAHGYNPTHQWLTNRGYAVISVNYRGSTGFGKNFVNKGDGEWAGKMQRDLEDAANWAIDHNITTKDQVVIMGGSYGGYATLVGMTMTPDLYAAGIDIVGPSNLETLLNSIPPYWKSYIGHLKKEIGALPDTEEGRKFLAAKSPINFVQNIKKPLLIAQGAHDPRVKQSESDQIVAAMKKNNIPVMYLLYEDEGHGFARPENRISFYANAEMFLANILKGRFISNDGKFPGSSVKIIEGKNLGWTKQVSE